MKNNNTIVRFMQRYMCGDIVTWSAIILLSIFGLLTSYSSCSSLVYRRLNNNFVPFFIKHLINTVFGLYIVWMVHRIDYIHFASLSKVGVVVSVITLIISWRYGVNINGASRWIKVPYINLTFQPSDFAQLSLVVYLPYSISILNGHKPNNDKSMLIVIFLICGLVSLTKFSKAVLLFTLCMIMMFIGKYPLKKLVSLSAYIIICVCMVALCFGQRRQTIINRLRNFSTNYELPYQTHKAFNAISNGGIYGIGPGNSTQRFFLPYSHSDYVYPIIIEEYGVIVGIIIIIIYLTLVYRGIVTAKNKNCDTFAKLLCISLTLNVAMQAIANIGVTLGLLPPTGIQLPLISTGGTSMIFTCVCFGIILSVQRRVQANQL